MNKQWEMASNTPRAPGPPATGTKAPGRTTGTQATGIVGNSDHGTEIGLQFKEITEVNYINAYFKHILLLFT